MDVAEMLTRLGGAGSEKWRTSYDLGSQRIAELTSINQSLSTLGVRFLPCVW